MPSASRGGGGQNVEGVFVRQTVSGTDKCGWKGITHGFAGVSAVQGCSTPHLDMTSDWLFLVTTAFPCGPVLQGI